MKIKDLPKFNRPASKLYKKGASSLDTAELLSVIFGKGTKGESALELANKLLKKYNLHKFEEIGFRKLTEECRGDYIKTLRILSLIELSKRYNKLVNKGYKRNISCAKDVYDMFADEMKNYKKEVLKVVLLDTKNKIIYDKEVDIINVKEVSVGTLNSSLIHPREVFKEAIRENVNAIILVHNHPSGDCNPSGADEDITNRFNESGKLLKIKLIDHIIIGKGKYYSFREKAKLI